MTLQHFWKPFANTKYKLQKSWKGKWTKCSQEISEPFLKVFLCLKVTASSSSYELEIRVKQTLEIPSQTCEQNKFAKQGKVVEI